VITVQIKNSKGFADVVQARLFIRNAFKNTLKSGVTRLITKTINVTLEIFAIFSQIKETPRKNKSPNRNNLKNKHSEISRNQVQNDVLLCRGAIGILITGGFIITFGFCIIVIV